MSRHNRHQNYRPQTRRDAQLEAQTREQLANHRLLDYDEDDDFEEDLDELEEPEVEPVHKPTPPSKPKVRPIYVLDTNLLISCVDVLYDPDDETWRPPLDFEPDLEDAHLVVPDIVREELNAIKSREHSHRSMCARIALERLAKFFPNSKRSMSDVLNLKHPIPTGWGDQVISQLPLHRNFGKSLPFVPDREDNDGWIAVTALAASLINEGHPIDGSADVDLLARPGDNDNVVLLTNDNDLRSKADNYGVRTDTYDFTPRPPFTGCREVTIPAKLFEKFYHEDNISRAEFEHALPEELPLVANEYVIMTPEDDRYPRGYFTDSDQFKNVARYHRKNDRLYPLRFVKYEGKEAPNAGIATYYDALNDEKVHVLVVTGEAGTGKTFQAIFHGIKVVREGKYRQIILLMSCSSKNPLGALPGGEEEKKEPMVGFVKDAIESYLLSTPEFKKKRELLRRFHDCDDEDEDSEEESSEETEARTSKKNRRQDRPRRRNETYDPDIDEGYDDYEDEYDARGRKSGKNKTFYPSKSDKKASGNNGEKPSEKMTFNEMLKKQRDYIYNRYFVSVPYEYARGRSFDDSFIILDEAQRVEIDTSETLLSRPGKNSKLVVCGDLIQIPKNTPEKQMMNGLSYARMNFFDNDACAHIHLTENMRGDISEILTTNRRAVRRRLGEF